MTKEELLKEIKEKDATIAELGRLLLMAYKEMKKLEPLLKRQGLSLAFYQFNAQLQESTQGVLKNVGSILNFESEKQGVKDEKVYAGRK